MGGRRREAVGAAKSSAPARTAPLAEGRERDATPHAVTGHELIDLQRSLGNRHVQGQVQQVRSASGGESAERQADQVARSVARGIPGPPVRRAPGGRPAGVDGTGVVDPGVRRAVQAARGGGHRVPDGVRRPMEEALAADFGGVRLHADGQADALNRTLQARAFTTGRDIFFRRGEYDPGSPGGKELLAHELTHVVQQDGAGAGAVLQRKPVKRKDGKYTDAEMPGVGLVATGSTDNSGNVGYRISGTNIEFDYNTQTDTYSQRGKDIDPDVLARRALAVLDRSDSSSESEPKLKKKKEEPKRKVKKRKKYSSSSSSSSSESSSSEEPEPESKPTPKPKPTKGTKRTKRKADEELDELGYTTKSPRSAAYDEDFSEMSSSSDDETSTLTNKQKLKRLQSYGKLKHRRLSQRSLPKSKTTFTLDDPRVRKTYAAHRTLPNSSIVNSTTLQSGTIGPQRINFQKGTGHFVTAGGNKDRPSSVKEPAADYATLLTGMLDLGGDANARTLLRGAGDKSKIVDGKLSDRQVAAIVMHYMNNPFPTDLKRTQLTEHLGKLLAVFMSETARSLEGIGGAYDSTVLIKAGLRAVLRQEATLRSLFFRGTGGAESTFLGAPSGAQSKTGIGGAEQLRNPLGHPDAFNRQMALFPDNKGDFKRSVNRLRTGSTTKVPDLTEADLLKAANDQAADEVAQAEVQLKNAQHTKVPANINYKLDFMAKLGKTISALVKQRNRMKARKNKEAAGILQEAIDTLVAVRDGA